MNSPSRYRLRRADASDAPQVHRVFSQQSFEGGIAVAYLRSPDPLQSFLREGDELVMMVLLDHEEQDLVIGIGGCVIRAGYAAGRRCRIGYLTGLKLLREYHGKIVSIPVFYDELHQLTRNKVDVYVTTILSDNVSAQNMLEKRRKRMPAYCFLGEYHTFFCRTGRTGGCQIPKGVEIKTCAGEEAALFYRDKVEKENFAVADALQNDLKHADFYGLYLEGKLLAVGYVLDQREYKQYVVHHYSGIYQVLSKLPTGLLGYPDFPKVGETANCAAAGIWYSREAADPVQLAGILFRRIRERAVRFSFLIIGVYEGTPLMETFGRMQKIDYPSRVYQVCWNGETPVSEKGRVHLEVGFL